MSFTLNKIINLLKKKDIIIQCNLSNDIIIEGVESLVNSKNNYISFFHNSKYKNDIINTKAKACFINKEYSNLLPKNCIPLITNNPYQAFIHTLNIFFPLKKSNGKISKNAIIHNNSKIESNVEIQDGVIIKENVFIGKDSIVSSNTTIDENVHIYSNVTISNNCHISNCVIQKNTTIQSGVVIGTPGFSFAIENEDSNIMNHLGKVIIGKNVRIGANSTIVRGSLLDTVISDNVKIDNLVHISHNVKIGKGSIIAAQSGIAGSTSIGENVIMGGQVGISGHLIIGNNVKIAAKSGVIKNIEDNVIVGGYPAVKIKDWHRSTIKLYSKNKL